MRLRRRRCACGCGAALHQHQNGRWPSFIRGHHLFGTAENLFGAEFGCLLVTGAPYVLDGRTFHPCQCACGATVAAEAWSLKSGKRTSCGITCVARPAHRKTHGMSGTPTYQTWLSMLARCYNPKSTSYCRYGAVGIAVGLRWRSFDAFFADMGERPEGKTLERRDGTLGYYKGNCRWATAREQAANRKSSTYVTIEGEEMVFAEAVRRYGAVSYPVAKNRVNALGWDATRAITTPPFGGR